MSAPSAQLAGPTSPPRRAQARARLSWAQGPAVSQAPADRVVGAQRRVVARRRPCRGRVPRAGTAVSLPASRHRLPSCLALLSQYNLYCDTIPPQPSSCLSHDTILYRDTAFPCQPTSIAIQYNHAIQFFWSQYNPCIVTQDLNQPPIPLCHDTIAVL